MTNFDFMENFVTDINDLDLKKTYTYSDYILWKFKERVELIKGKIFKMSPAPNISHQEISRNINRILDHYFFNKSCKVFYAPSDVLLTDKKKTSEENEIYTVVQPDLCVICDLEKIADGKKCLGAPDLVIEILSPGNSKKEMDSKFDLYQESGVLEYWLVYPEEKSINIFVLKDNKYIGLKPVSEGQILTSYIFPELKADMDKILI